VSGTAVTQRDIDIWRVEAKATILKLFEEWRKNYLGKRVKDAISPSGRPPTTQY
jgi:hypothetical protein